MKKSNLIIAAVFALGFFTTTTVKAIQPMQITELLLSFNTEMVFEEEVKLENWMIAPASFSNPAIETELELEDWMIKTFDAEDTTIALEDWMTRIAV